MVGAGGGFAGGEENEVVLAQTECLAHLRVSSFDSAEIDAGANDVAFLGGDSVSQQGVSQGGAGGNHFDVAVLHDGQQPFGAGLLQVGGGRVDHWAASAHDGEGE